MSDGSIYDPAFVRRLFDDMARTYGVVNLVSSFGFAAWWRRACLRLAPVGRGCVAVDLMTGMGELCPGLARRTGPGGSVVAVDLSPAMCARARSRTGGCAAPVAVAEADVLADRLLDLVPAGQADVVVSSFGLKTFAPEQSPRLAGQVARLLKPGGSFAFLEISVPPNRWLRAAFLFYLRHVIPRVGRLFLGDPDTYRMLARYTEAFGTCAAAARAFAAAGLEVRSTSHFFGCATGFAGRKPGGDT